MALSALLGAVFPKAWRSTRWPVGLGRRGAAAYIAVNALAIFAARQLGHRMREEHDATVAEARARLGREPTESEVRFEYGRAMMRRTLGREPTDDEVQAVPRRAEA